MKKPTLALVAAAALTLIAAPAFAADQANGLTFNGISLNSAKLNGLKMNGLKVNGLKWNGIQFNGRLFNGKMFNGRMFNGTQGGSEAAIVPIVTTVRLASGKTLAVR